MEQTKATLKNLAASAPKKINGNDFTLKVFDDKYHQFMNLHINNEKIVGNIEIDCEECEIEMVYCKKEDLGSPDGMNGLDFEYDENDSSENVWKMITQNAKKFFPSN